MLDTVLEVSTRFRSPQALRRTLAALGILHRAFSLLNRVETSKTVSNYYVLQVFGVRYLEFFGEYGQFFLWCVCVRAFGGGMLNVIPLKM